MDTQALLRQGATRPPVTSNFPPTAYSNSKTRDVHSSLSHMCALKGCAGSHTQGCGHTQSSHVPPAPHTPTLGPHSTTTCPSTAGPCGNVLGVLLWGFFPSREMVVGADRGRLRCTQVVEGLAPREASQRPRGVMDSLGQPDTRKC